MVKIRPWLVLCDSCIYSMLVLIFLFISSCCSSFLGGGRFLVISGRRRASFSRVTLVSSYGEFLFRFLTLFLRFFTCKEGSPKLGFDFGTINYLSNILSLELGYPKRLIEV